MTNSELTQVLLLLLLLVGLAQLLGWLFVKMRQPKVVGEILAGVVLGNALIGRLPFAAHFIQSAKNQGNILDFIYWLGLLLLMFLAGAETQQLFTREERREVGWLIPAQYVKPYVKTNKNDDYIDAEAIAEAVGRPRMRFVPIKSDDQLDLQSLHRVRERWVMRRTAVVNQIRGLLLERGTTLRKGRRYVDEVLPAILAGGSSKLSEAVLVLLAELKQELEQLAEKIDRADRSIERIARENEACRRLVAMPGVGPVTATAIIATIGNGAAFGKGRDFAAWLGVVPEEHSTGGKQTLWKIPQRGNQYLRRLFVQGARAVMQHRTKQSPGLSAWLAQLTARTHQNVAIVALANKLARMAWAVLTKNEAYRPPLLAGTSI